MEEEEENEADIPRLIIQELIRQVANRRWFTLYEKMAAVRKIQWHIEASDLSMRAVCRFANLHNRQSSPGKVTF